MGTYDDITQAESSGNAKKPNPNSSALGLGQFVNGTWLDMIRRYHPELAQGKSPDQILAMRTDPVLSREMTAKYAEENEAKLRQAGIPVTPGSTYLMHFAGPSGGVALMKADPNAPVESILSDQAIKANSFLKGKTASWVLAWVNKKMADAAKSRVTPAQAQPVPYVAQTQAVESAFGATSWPPHPASPNILPLDAAHSPARTARAAPIPFLGGTGQAQQSLDNSLPAPGAASWDLSNRFGTWDTNGGASVPAQPSDGLRRTSDDNRLGNNAEPFAQARVDPSLLLKSPGGPSDGSLSSVRKLASRVSNFMQVDPSDGLQDTAHESAAGLPVISPVWHMPDALSASSGDRSLNDLLSPLPFHSGPLLAQASPGGIPGLLKQMGAFDPSNADQPPAGGLLRLLQEYMRNNPGGSTTP